MADPVEPSRAQAIRQRCEAPLGTTRFACDRWRGHTGQHRAYLDTVDEVVFYGEPDDLMTRVREYLSFGGLWNPELMPAHQVSTLVQDLAAELSALRAHLQQAEEKVEYLTGDCHICHHKAGTQDICSRCHHEHCLPCQVSSLTAQLQQAQEQIQRLQSRVDTTGASVSVLPRPAEGR